MSEAPQANQPIVLSETHLTEIGGKPAEVPVKALLQLLPQPRVILEVPDLPTPHFATATNSDALDVHLKTGESLRVRLIGWGFTAGRDATVYPATFGPYEQPCVVMDDGQPLSSTTAAILNFSQFYGSMDYFPETGDSRERVGSVTFSGDGWEVVLSAFSNLPDQIKILRAQGGHGFTHTCSIKRADGGSYGSHDVDELLNALRLLLTFARGAFCGITNVTGRTTEDSVSFVRWGTHSTEGWRTPRSWLPKAEGGDILRDLFPGFLSEWARNTDSKETVSRAINWYANSNTSPIHVGTILTQAALEILSAHVLQRERKGQRTAEFIKDGLVRAGITPTIPSSLPDLEALRQAKKLQKKKNWDTGPDTLAKIRNDIVHSKQLISSLPTERQIDAWHLGQWYIELMLFKLFGYGGSYVSRLTGNIERVPWAPPTAQQQSP